MQNSNFSIDFLLLLFFLLLPFRTRVYFNRSPINPQGVKISFSRAIHRTGESFIAYDDIEIETNDEISDVWNGAVLDFHPVIGSALGAIITDRRDPSLTISDVFLIRSGGAIYGRCADRLPRGCNGKTVGLYARLRISIYYTGTNILYAERRCPMCNFDASLPVSRDPPCYSLYIRFSRIGRRGRRTDGRVAGGGGGGEKGKEEKDGGTREREKKGLWIRGNLKREKRKRAWYNAAHGYNDCFSPPGEADAIR